MYKRFLVWFIICNLVIIGSAFIHEIAHGVSATLRGNSISTGFNRIGTIYKKPSDPDFRSGLEFSAIDSLLDFAPATTMLLAVVFTVIFCHVTYDGSLIKICIYALAVCNSFLRVIPVGIALFTGRVEDEIGQGIALVEIFGLSFLKFAPALISISVSAICLYFVYNKYSQIINQGIHIPRPTSALIAFGSAFIIINVLDNHIRINWVS